MGKPQAIKILPNEAVLRRTTVQALHTEAIQDASAPFCH